MAELKAVSFIMEHNLPISLLDHLTPLCKSMFPDSNIARKMLCGRTKGSGIIFNVFKQQSFENIVLHLKKYPFSLIVDETTDVSVAKSLAIVARYCKDDCLVNSIFFSFLHVKSAKAEDVASAISTLITSNDIPAKDFLEFGADNASVMMGRIGGVGARLKELNHNLFVMGCVYHSFNLCSSKASEKLPRSVEEFVRDVSNYFSNSAKRIEAFEEFQEYSQTARHRLLRFCITRWLSMQMVVNRILEQWSALKLFFIAEVADENSLHKAKSILDAFNNPIFHIYLYFLSYILKIINDMNLEFQSVELKLFILASRLRVMYKTVLKSFMKKAVLNNTKLSKIDPSKPEHFLPLEEIYVGTSK
ncbi:hypothetical protein NQ314_009613 [Rhamnusium bicolor]|uniref:DUF4371 domain-containing protein n=1 Tax=Rhamnusium bicolor TaxID=1586634 RepID=A0AAV8Y105_9CUCU|nr:hypothetical protein NQ314_009613 [Rhamnusium bicolor]